MLFITFLVIEYLTKSTSSLCCPAASASAMTP
ncbi:unnamed protein product, partial [Vitis vinifera]|uniref:Uncharacterized protein n=1 Tax=Vitis vinifera TaxID=29760 RepID=D7TCK2_VITVI